MVPIYIYREHPDAVVPEVAYEDTSACFDITSIKDIIIGASSSAVVPCGLRMLIDENEGYYMRFSLRSSYGFSKDMICHPGILDGGYTGDYGVKVYNLSPYSLKIEKGKRFAQVEVLKKNPHKMIELSRDMFFKIAAKQKRGTGREGSSGK